MSYSFFASLELFISCVVIVACLLITVIARRFLLFDEDEKLTTDSARIIIIIVFVILFVIPFFLAFFASSKLFIISISIGALVAILSMIFPIFYNAEKRSTGIAGIIFIILFVVAIILNQPLLLKRLKSIIQSIESVGGSGTDNTVLFVLFYLITPIVLSITMVLLGAGDLIFGLYTVIKGAFYLCLATISTLQLIYVEDTDLGKLALGMTLSIAVYEANTALFDGLKRIIKT